LARVAHFATILAVDCEDVERVEVRPVATEQVRVEVRLAIRIQAHELAIKNRVATADAVHDLRAQHIPLREDVTAARDQPAFVALDVRDRGDRDYSTRNYAGADRSDFAAQAPSQLIVAELSGRLPAKQQFERGVNRVELQLHLGRPLKLDPKLSVEFVKFGLDRSEDLGSRRRWPGRAPLPGTAGGPAFTRGATRHFGPSIAFRALLTPRGNQHVVLPSSLIAAVPCPFFAFVFAFVRLRVDQLALARRALLRGGLLVRHRSSQSDIVSHAARDRRSSRAREDP
jgi:hypothetical protein